MYVGEKTISQLSTKILPYLEYRKKCILHQHKTDLSIGKKIILHVIQTLEELKGAGRKIHMKVTEPVFQGSRLQNKKNAFANNKCESIVCFIYF